MQRSKIHTTRRGFLMGSAGGCAVLSSGVRAFASANAGTRDTLVVVFLRGGMDALSLFVPVADGDYYAQRPTMAVPANRTLDLDGFFGLNDAASALMPWYQAGQLAVVHTCGLAHPTRSHFEAMRRIEEAHVGGGTLGTGWIARHLGSTPPVLPGAARALSLGTTLPTSLQGSSSAIPVPSLGAFGFSGPLSTQVARANRLDAMYSRAPEPDRSGGLTALTLATSLAGLDFVNRVPEGGAVYPGGAFGQGLYESATVIKGGVGAEVLEVDLGDWDDHSHEGPVTGYFAARIELLARGLDAFMRDLASDADRTTVLVLSEFGRRVDENGSAGCDHGRGGAVMVLGGQHVNGGVVHRIWPGLAPANLDDGALPVAIDVRHVFAELLQDRLQTGDLSAALPGFTPTPLGLVG